MENLRIIHEVTDGKRGKIYFSENTLTQIGHYKAIN